MDGVKVTIKKNPAKKPVAQKAEPAEQISKNKSRSGGTWKFIIVLLLTAIVVGGAVYGWQKKSTDSSINKISQESRTVRQQFENQIETLKDTLSSMQNENETLKKTKEELDSVKQQLTKATIKYSNNELGLSFEYPAVLGDVKVTISNADKGKIFTGTFTGDEKLVFGGISQDYTNATNSTFIDSRGYLKKGSKYFYLFLGDKGDTDFEIKPAKTVKAGDNEILLIDKTSFIGNNPENSKLNPGEGNLGALVNLKKGFPGIAFLNQDQTTFSQADFEKMLSTINVSK